MKCPKCNAEVRDGSKFCTSCGTKMEAANLCAKCGAPLKPGVKFCTSCGTRVAPAEVKAKPESEAPVQQGDIETVKGRICWNVQPGQVARVINEKEFDSYKGVQGVIIPEGTTAYIRANGHTIAAISGGSYDFVKSSGVSRTTTSHVAEEVGENVRSGWNFILNLFKKSKDKKTPDSEPGSKELYEEQQKLIINNAKNGAAFSVIILLDKLFPLLIGAKQKDIDSYKEFVPMTVKTKFVDVKLGINGYFKIVDPDMFITHYLTDKQILNSASIVDEISDSVRSAVQEVLYDVELTANHIPQSVHAQLKERINDVAVETFFGISMVRIVEISTANEDLDRFRALSAEMYLSEQELDYLKRTNDFKNRMADVVNAQRLHEARDEFELQRALDLLNNDKLLHEDELEKFKHLLHNERLVREAKSDAERDAALREIAKTKLVEEDELKAIEDQVKTNTYKRGALLQMMQLKDSIEFERVRLEGEHEKAISIVKKDLEVQGLKDEYADTRFYKDLEKQRAKTDFELDVEQRKRDMAFDDDKRRREMEREDDELQFKQFLAMQSAEEQARENQRRHEAEMERERLQREENKERIRAESARELSDEKVWAMYGSEAAAVAYAENKYNAEAQQQARADLEAQRREYEARMDRDRAARDAEHMATQDRLFQMMDKVLASNGNAQQQKLEDRERELREKEERIRRQEERMDTAYDRALDYTTRNNTASAKCPECGASLAPGLKFCGECGAVIN